ncbi:hypothetical protein EYF80_041306 [Liparis tanakae]|uniref:Uncharacterized protein n=1 Tax=Liparis tanakae TaxID=230148 RepID=A0A4Z2G5X5_9TELE|nr:hypothetical protein EYF80_041306 [Liparis tanakae]
MEIDIWSANAARKVRTETKLGPLIVRNWVPLPSRSVRMKSDSFGGAKLEVEVEAMLTTGTSNAHQISLGWN